MSDLCPDCGGTDPYPHNPGCLALARIQRDQLRAWRAAGGQPDPARWGAREAEIARLLASVGADLEPTPQTPSGGRPQT